MALALVGGLHHRYADLAFEQDRYWGSRRSEQPRPKSNGIMPASLAEAAYALRCNFSRKSGTAVLRSRTVRECSDASSKRAQRSCRGLRRCRGEATFPNGCRVRMNKTIPIAMTPNWAQWPSRDKTVS